MRPDKAFPPVFPNGLPTIGYFIQDDACHWYFIPEGQIDEFRVLRDAIEADDTDYDAQDKFGVLFDDLRIDGHPSQYRVTRHGDFH